MAGRYQGQRVSSIRGTLEACSGSVAMGDDTPENARHAARQLSAHFVLWRDDDCDLDTSRRNRDGKKVKL